MKPPLRPKAFGAHKNVHTDFSAPFASSLITFCAFFTFTYPVRIVEAPTDDFATSSLHLHLFLFSTALWELANSSPVQSLNVSCLPFVPLTRQLQG